MLGGGKGLERFLGVCVRVFLVWFLGFFEDSLLRALLFLNSGGQLASGQPIKSHGIDLTESEIDIIFNFARRVTTTTTE